MKLKYSNFYFILFYFLEMTIKTSQNDFGFLPLKTQRTNYLKNNNNRYLYFEMSGSSYAQRARSHNGWKQKLKKKQSQKDFSMGTVQVRGSSFRDSNLNIIVQYYNYAIHKSSSNIFNYYLFVNIFHIHMLISWRDNVLKYL